jgi:hypothetical protein
VVEAFSELGAPATVARSASGAQEEPAAVEQKQQ